MLVRALCLPSAAMLNRFMPIPSCLHIVTIFDAHRNLTLLITSHASPFALALTGRQVQASLGGPQVAPQRPSYAGAQTIQKLAKMSFFS